MESNISIANIGPIARLSIPIPDEGGMVVLKGRNGCGKTESLDAIQSALTGKGKPPLRDLATKGEIAIGGVRLTVAKSVRRSGQLEVTTLEGKLSIGDLVDPGLLDPVRADATRIKALVELSGIGIEEDDLVGFPAEVLEGIPLADPVAAMAELKRRLDIGAREYEKLAAAEQAKVKALLETLGDEFPSGPMPDQDALRTATIDAIRSLDRLRAEQAVATEAAQKAQKAREQLQTVPEIDLERLLSLRAEVETQLADKEEQISLLKKRLEESKHELNLLLAQHENADLQIKQAKQQIELRTQLEHVIAASEHPGPSQTDVDVAATALEAAKQAEAAADRLRQQLTLKDKADYAAEEADRLSSEAVFLRRKAKQTDEVLSEIVGNIPDCPLRIESGRLIIDTKRGPTFFSDLSMGEKYRVVLPIAMRAVGKQGLIVLSQEAFEGLDPTNRRTVADMARELGILIITAECSDDPEITTEIV